MPIAIASLATVTAFIAALIGLLAGIGGLAVFPEYRRRLQAQRAERDTQLAQLFAELVPIADGYGQPALPDSALASIVDDLVAKDRLDDLRPTLRKAYVNAPVGMATQSTAIASIVYLGSTYESLAAPAETCLETLRFPGGEALEATRRRALDKFGARSDGLIFMGRAGLEPATKGL